VEKWATRGILGIMILAVDAGAAGLLAAGNEMEGGLNQMRNGQGKWFAIAHSKIATVDWAAELNWGDKLAIKIHGKSLVKVAFKKQGVKPLVFVVAAAQAGSFSISNLGKDF